MSTLHFFHYIICVISLVRDFLLAIILHLLFYFTFFFNLGLQQQKSFLTQFKAFYHKRDQTAFIKGIPAVICLILKCRLLIMINVSWSLDNRGYENCFKSYHRWIIYPLYIYMITLTFLVLTLRKRLWRFLPVWVFFYLKTRLYWNLMTEF